MHWQVGEDPSTYDWQATTHSVREKLQVEDEASTARRAKLQRKAERHLKRQRRETQAMRQKAESQPTLIRQTGLRSSPGPAFPSSSQAPTQSQVANRIVVASQVERGMHGGRSVVAKKKKRVSGF
jgi:RNA polymerase I-specific transcription initiation factor RRN6